MHSGSGGQGCWARRERGMITFGSIGIVCQVLGLILTAAGLTQTWKAYAGEPFLRPVTARLARAGDRGRAFLRRIFRRPQPRIVGIMLAGSSAGVGNARGRMTYGRLDKHDAIAAIGQLEARTKELASQVADVGDRVADLGVKVDQELAELAAKQAFDVARLEAMSREVALDGIRLEAVGLVVLAVGTMFQALGAL